MPQLTSSSAQCCCGSLSHGLLYCIASLVLGIELNIVGPTVNSLAAQVGVTEAALGGGEFSLLIAASVAGSEC